MITENELAGLGLRMSGYLCTHEAKSKAVSETSERLGIADEIK